MPLPAAGAVALGLAGPILGGLFSSGQNRSSQRFSREMYDRQRQDAIDFWNMQNEYNHPSAQMSRLKEGGLNPHLVYGGSSGGVAGVASTPSKPSPVSAQFTPPMQGLDLLGSYFDYELKSAQADNLRAQNTVILEDAALKAATREFTGVKSKTAEQSSPFLVEAAKEQVRKLKADTDMSISENERRTAMTASNLSEAAERILTMRVGRANTRALMRGTELSSRLKELDIDLRKAGINPSDPMWTRVLGRVLNEAVENASPIWKSQKATTKGSAPFPFNLRFK